MRKTAVLVLGVLLLSAAAGAALDVGIGAGYRYQYTFLTDFTTYHNPEQQHSWYLDLRAWPYPLQLGIGVSRVFGFRPTGVPIPPYLNAVVNADYWLLDIPLGSLPLSLHLGAGVWASLPVFTLGIRGPVGLRWTPIPADRGFEVSLEIVPIVGAAIAPWPALDYGASAGLTVRYWFGR